jgi:5-formyltetrahydrofolate cyclo-ligase
MTIEYDANNRSSIRQFMRNQRNQLTDQQQLVAAKRLSQNILSQPWYQRVQNIGIYLANDGEVDPIVLATKALFRGKSCFLPSLHPLKKGQLWFGDYQGPSIKNKFGIPEPDHNRNNMHTAKQMDVVFMPLVAFDKNGGRLGMGGGFYDRTFEFLKTTQNQKPKLIGLAHHFQEVTSLPIESWDIPLSAIITDQGIIHVRNNSTSE